MNFSKRQRFRLPIFKPGDISNTISLILPAIEVELSDISLSATEYLPDGTVSRKKIAFADLYSICDLTHLSITLYKGRPQGGEFFISIGTSGNNILQLNIDTESGKLLSDVVTIFRDSLKLEEAPDEKATGDGNESALLNPIIKRIEDLEAALFAPSRRLRCFLSYRFNDDNEILSLRVQQFLNLLNVDVLTGTTYEPRQVSEKVLSRLRQPLDFIVLLITSHGESMWTRDEIAVATHRGIALIPLLKKVLNLNRVYLQISSTLNSHKATLAIHSLNFYRQSISYVSRQILL